MCVCVWGGGGGGGGGGMLVYFLHCDGIHWIISFRSVYFECSVTCKSIERISNVVMFALCQLINSPADTKAFPYPLGRGGGGELLCWTARETRAQQYRQEYCKDYRRLQKSRSFNRKAAQSPKPQFTWCIVELGPVQKMWLN